MKETVRTRRIRNLKTAWIEAGSEEGPILLFLHGYPDLPEIWRNQIEHFKNRFHIIAPYTRGAGPSEPASDISRYGQNSVALDLMHILKSVNPESKKRVYCIGHDLGAVQAWALAALLGKELSGLVIINGLSLTQMARRWNRPEQWARSWYIPIMLLPKVPELVGKLLPNDITALAYRLGGLKKDFRPQVKSPGQGVANPSKQYKALAQSLPEALTSSPSPIPCPLLVIFGNEDSFLANPTLDEIEPECPKATIRILKGNHWVHRENPDEVNRLMDQFFTEPGNS